MELCGFFNTNKKTIIQFGRGSKTINFPISFKSTPYTCVGTVHQQWGHVVCVKTLSKSQVYFDQWQSAGGGNTTYTVNYVAIGY